MMSVVGSRNMTEPISRLDTIHHDRPFLRFGRMNGSTSFFFLGGNGLGGRFEGLGPFVTFVDGGRGGRFRGLEPFVAFAGPW